MISRRSKPGSGPKHSSGRERGRAAEATVTTRVSAVHHPLAFCSVVLLVIGMFAGNTRLPRVIPVLSEVPVAVIIFLLSGVLAVLQGYRHTGTHRVPGAMRVTLLVMTCYCWWLIVSIFWAPSSYYALGAAFDVLILLLSAVISYLVFASFGQGAWPVVWRTILVMTLIFAIAGFLGDGTQTGRMAAFGGGPNVFVRFMLLGVLASILIYLETRRPAVLLLLPLYFSAAILSGSRGGLLATGIAMLMVLGYLWWLKRARLILGLGFLGAGGTVLLLSIGAVREQVEELIFGRFVELTFEEGYSSGRGSLLDQASQAIRESPLLGTGVGGFNYLFGRSSGIEHPHNIFLTTWTESGPVGLVILIALCLVIAVAMLRRWNSTGAFFASVASIAILICAQFSGYYLDSRLIWFFAFMCLAVNVVPHNNEKRPDGKTELEDVPNGIVGGNRSYRTRRRTRV